MARTKFIKSPWTISIGTTIFSFTLTIIYDFLKEKPVLTTVGSILKTIWDFIVAVLTFNIKVWWIIVFILLGIIILFLIDKFKKEETFMPDFNSYRKDNIKGWNWHWEWIFNKNEGKWRINNLRPYCPSCDTPLLEGRDTWGIIFDCPRCSYSKQDLPFDIKVKVDNIIADNINRKNTLQ